MTTTKEKDLIFENINFVYKEKFSSKIIFKDFNYKIKKGKFTSIIGPSGSGKTS